MYPVSYQADVAIEGRNRLTTALRYFVNIPWAIWGAIYGFGASIASFIAWFALLFTARYPQGLYDFVAGYLRYQARHNAFAFLMTDEYPPFHGNPDPNYPAAVEIPAPLAEYSRLKVFFRFLIGIPVMILALVQIVIAAVIALIAWFSIVFTGGFPDGMVESMRSAQAYNLRASAYFAYMTEDWPPFTLEEGPPAGQIPASPPPAVPPAAPAPGASESQPPPPAAGA
jgi:hypothetical protein